jgi:hypothetical protein
LIIYSRWNRNITCHYLFLVPFTPATLTLFANGRTTAVTGGAGCLHPENATRLDNLAVATAVLACIQCCTTCRTVALTVVAATMPSERYLFFNASRSCKKVNRQITFNIWAAPSPTTTPSPTKNAAAKHISKGFKNITQIMKLLAATLETCVPISIIA